MRVILFVIVVLASGCLSGGPHPASHDMPPATSPAETIIPAFEWALKTRADGDDDYRVELFVGETDDVYASARSTSSRDDYTLNLHLPPALTVERGTNLSHSGRLPPEGAWINVTLMAAEPGEHTVTFGLVSGSFPEKTLETLVYVVRSR